MKKLFRFALCVAVSAFAMTSFTACDDDPEPNPNPDPETPADPKDAELKVVAEQFVSATVNETYKLLADSTGQLCDALIELRESVRNKTVTDDQVKNVCEIFLHARSNYETSEAFLFGAASDFGIDPHIDTWPLDLGGLAVALTNDLQIAAMDKPAEGEEWTGDQYAGNKMGQELLGFHGIEFVIFRDGAPRTAADLLGVEDNADFLAAAKGKQVSGLNEVIFAAAVAGDLRNRCWQMEVAWNAEAPSDHMAKVADDLELPVTVNGGDYSYGDNFLAAGQAGSTYKTWREAMSAILIAGCKNISEEVGQQKMGKPHGKTDVNYIESPYSHMSLHDFADNMRSIENAYMGGRPELRDTDKSLHAYLAKYNADLDKKVTDAIADAIAKIEACPAPFVDNYLANEVQDAINACAALSSALQEANDWIVKN